MGKTLVTIFREAGIHPWASILAGSLFLAGILSSLLQLLKAPLTQDELMKVSGVLLTEPEVVYPLHTGKMHRSGRINLRMTSNGDIIFSVTGKSYSAAQVNAVDDHLHRLDSVELLVEADTYKRVLQAESGPKGWKPWPEAPENIPVYGLRAHQQDYLLWDDIDKSTDRDMVFTLLLLLLGGVWLFRDILQKLVFPKT